MLRQLHHLLPLPAVPSGEQMGHAQLLALSCTTRLEWRDSDIADTLVRAARASDGRKLQAQSLPLDRRCCARSMGAYEPVTPQIAH